MVTKTGFDAAALIPDIPRLLERGGMLSMLNTVLIAFCAYGFAGTLAVTGSLDIDFKQVDENSKNDWRIDCCNDCFMYYGCFCDE